MNARVSVDSKADNRVREWIDIVFPEIDYDKVDKIRGLDISISTSAEDDKSGEALLRAMKFPFKN